MGKHGKKYVAGAAKIEAQKQYPLDEAIKLAVETKYAKFDETVEMAVRLGVDPRQADQNVRGTVILPHGTGKSVRVLVIGKGDKVKEAEAAGADFAGAVGEVSTGAGQFVGGAEPVAGGGGAVSGFEIEQQFFATAGAVGGNGESNFRGAKQI